MRVDTSVQVDVRMAKTDQDDFDISLVGPGARQRHDVIVTEAMTVQLRAPSGGFHIECISPETQWLDQKLRHIGDGDFGNWRWSVMPTRAGKNKLQLVVSARTLDTDGQLAEAGLPDRFFDVSVGLNYRRTARFAALLVGAALIGGLFIKYGMSVYGGLIAMI